MNRTALNKANLLVEERDRLAAIIAKATHADGAYIIFTKKGESEDEAKKRGIRFDVQTALAQRVLSARLNEVDTELKVIGITDPVAPAVQLAAVVDANAEQ